MRRVIRTLCRGAFALAIAGALGFGAFQASAAAPAASQCDWDPPMLGECVGGQPGCQEACDLYYGPGYTGVCTQPDNCCVCYR